MQVFSPFYQFLCKTFLVKYKQEEKNAKNVHDTSQLHLPPASQKEYLGGTLHHNVALLGERKSRNIKLLFFCLNGPRETF